MTLAEQGVLPDSNAKIKIIIANGGNQRGKTHRQELALWQQMSFRSLNRSDMKTYDRKVVRVAVRNRLAFFSADTRRRRLQLGKVDF